MTVSGEFSFNQSYVCEKETHRIVETQWSALVGGVKQFRDSTDALFQEQVQTSTEDWTAEWIELVYANFPIQACLEVRLRRNSVSGNDSKEASDCMDGTPQCNFRAVSISIEDPAELSQETTYFPTTYAVSYGNYCNLS